MSGLRTIILHDVQAKDNNLIWCSVATPRRRSSTLAWWSDLWRPFCTVPRERRSIVQTAILHDAQADDSYLACAQGMTAILHGTLFGTAILCEALLRTNALNGTVFQMAIIHLCRIVHSWRHLWRCIAYWKYRGSNAQKRSIAGIMHKKIIKGQVLKVKVLLDMYNWHSFLIKAARKQYFAMLSMNFTLPNCESRSANSRHYGVWNAK